VSVGATIVDSLPTSEYSSRYSMRPPVIPPAPSRLTGGVVNLVVTTSRRTVSSSATAASKRGRPNARATHDAVDLIAGGAREARAPARGEQAEQDVDERARAAVEAGLREAGLPAEPAADRPGVWRVTVDRGVVEAVLRDTGESIQFLHELEYAAGGDDVEVLRWLLLAGDWNHARLGLATLPGGPGLFATCAVATLQAPALAWGVEQVLRLADDYDEKAGTS